MYCVAHMLKIKITSILAVNKTQIGSLGLDRTADGIGLPIGSDRIGSDWTGIFAFCAKQLCREKLFSMMTQVARNKKSEFPQQESNL